MLVRLGKVVALLMVVLWIPATSHCALEDTGAFTSLFACEGHDQDPRGGESGCSLDGCDLVESGDYRQDVAPVEIAAPLACALWTALFEVFARPSQDGSVFARLETASAAEDWTVFWRYVERVTPPARAPANLA